MRTLSRAEENNNNKTVRIRSLCRWQSRSEHLIFCLFLFDILLPVFKFLCSVAIWSGFRFISLFVCIYVCFSVSPQIRFLLRDILYSLFLYFAVYCSLFLHYFPIIKQNEIKQEKKSHHIDRLCHERGMQFLSVYSCKHSVLNAGNLQQLHSTPGNHKIAKLILLIIIRMKNLNAFIRFFFCFLLFVFCASDGKMASFCIIFQSNPMQ